VAKAESQTINPVFQMLQITSFYSSGPAPALHLCSKYSIFICMPQIQIPSPLRQYTGKQSTVAVPASTVGDALAGLVSQHPDLKRHLYSDDGKLRAFVNVYVNDEDMRYLEKEATAVQEGDTISIVPSIAGGSL
jgi:sulfur-carrier protein